MEKPSAYFEGILQLRNPTPEIINFIKKTVSKETRRMIAKEKKVVNGIDIYFADQHYLQNLGRKLKKQFSGILVISRRLHTVHRMTSKLLYRVTVLFRALPFKRGDVLTVGGEELEILHIDEKVMTKNVRTGKKEQRRIEELLRAV